MQDDRVVEIYTDGACIRNPGPGGWGAVLRYGGHEKELYGSEPGTTTNNRMELMAAIQALKKLTRPSVVWIYTDSTYVKDGITSWLPKWKANGWQTGAKQPVKNADLWRQLDDAAAPHEVEWHWIKGHAGHPENERADQLAVRGAQEASKAQAGIAVPEQQAKSAAPRPTQKKTGPSQRCKATTRAGKPCQTNAGSSGLCHVHDPALQCGAMQKNGKRCTVASGGGRCVYHRDEVDTVVDQGLFQA